MHCAICLNIRKGHKENLCPVCGELHDVNGYQVCDEHDEVMAKHESIFDALKDVRSSTLRSPT